jgi:predicted alpha/beta hydrolase
VSANPNSIQGLILIASCSVWYRGWDFPSNVGIIVMTQFIRAIAETMGYFPGKRFGFGGTESRKLIRDWSGQSLSGIYDPSGSEVDYEALLREVRVPILAISFATDRFAPYRAVQNLYRKMSRSPVTHWHYKADDLDLNQNQLNHFLWVKNSAPIVSKISEWIPRTPLASSPIT